MELTLKEMVSAKPAIYVRTYMRMHIICIIRKSSEKRGIADSIIISHGYIIDICT